MSQRRTAAAVKRSLPHDGEDRRTIDRRECGALDTEGSHESKTACIIRMTAWSSTSVAQQRRPLRTSGWLSIAPAKELGPLPAAQTESVHGVPPGGLFGA